MHPAAVSGEVILRMLAFPVAREPISSHGAAIGPRPMARATGCQHADRRIVGKNRLGRQGMASRWPRSRWSQALAEAVSPSPMTRQTCVPGQLASALRLRSGRSSFRSVQWAARSCFAGPLITLDQDRLPAERVLLQHSLGLSGQGRKAFAHVSDSRRQPDPRIGRNRDHAVRPRISCTSASGSYSPLIRIRCPPASSISILPVDGADPAPATGWCSGADRQSRPAGRWDHRSDSPQANSVDRAAT
jgi:hypothetical protein